MIGDGLMRKSKTQYKYATTQDGPMLSTDTIRKLIRRRLKPQVNNLVRLDALEITDKSFRR